MNTTQAYALADTLMKAHGLYRKGWKFEFFRSKRSFGRCLYQEKRILISSEFVKINDDHHVRDTILHEIAHALVGGRHGHDEVWQEKAREIGCDGKRFFDADAVHQPEKPCIGTCPHCGKTIERYRMTKIACKNCCNAYNGGRYSRKFLFIWRLKGSAPEAVSRFPEGKR